MKKPTFKFFLRDTSIKEDKEKIIYARVTIDRKKKDYSLKIRTLEKYFIESPVGLKAGHPRYTEDNLTLQYYDTNLRKLSTDALFEGKTLTFPDYDSIFYGDIFLRTCFYAYVENLTRIKRGKISPATEKLWNSEVTKLKECSPELLFVQINLAFLNRYEKFLREDKKHKPITIHKSHRFLKARLNDAFREGLIKINPYSKYSIGMAPEGNMERLTIEEVKKLESIYNSGTLPAHQKRVLRYFLFSCFAGGLRFSDLKALTYGNINGGKMGKSIEFRVQKTDEMLNFSLPKRAIYFLGEGLPQEKVFQMGTNQYSNRELKNIMTTAEINKNIHMHCSRHTFGTIALELGVPLEVVQKIMGHRNISTTKRYAKVVDASVKKGMMMMDGM